MNSDQVVAMLRSEVRFCFAVGTCHDDQTRFGKSCNNSLLATERILKQLYVSIKVRINFIDCEHRGEALGQFGRVGQHVNPIGHAPLGADGFLAPLGQLRWRAQRRPDVCQIQTLYTHPSVHKWWVH